MVVGWILVEHTNVDEDRLRSLSLQNAKQLVIGGVPGQVMLHIAANSSRDLNGAVLEVAKIPGVSKTTVVNVQNT